MKLYRTDTLEGFTFKKTVIPNELQVMDISIQFNHEIESKKCYLHGYDDVCNLVVATMLGGTFTVDNAAWSKVRKEEKKQTLRESVFYH